MAGVRYAWSSDRALAYRALAYRAQTGLPQLAAAIDVIAKV